MSDLEDDPLELPMSLEDEELEELRHIHSFMEAFGEEIQRARRNLEEHRELTGLNEVLQREVPDIEQFQRDVNTFTYSLQRDIRRLENLQLTASRLTISTQQSSGQGGDQDTYYSRVSMIYDLPAKEVDQQMIDSAMECPICLNPLELNEIVAVLHCEHMFHTGCIAQWLRRSNSCPLCRGTIRTRVEIPGSNNGFDQSDSDDSGLQPERHVRWASNLEAWVHERYHG
ncbi:uncharacterized protein N7483_000083 [Penicillium malachiteum]|uniref:uncharacterized protein n=1 Tax=Penicillium malachiteum TaxID=1324776 RepID=UPI002548B50B|nr:uncharacterized protein N7483_000083 [Penicillium malachiteum]KAJ5734958.1 hypothetical protein N7483_000083 [Penicillium malachiteum]